MEFIISVKSRDKSSIHPQKTKAHSGSIAIVYAYHKEMALQVLCILKKWCNRSFFNASLKIPLSPTKCLCEFHLVSEEVWVSAGRRGGERNCLATRLRHPLLTPTACSCLENYTEEVTYDTSHIHVTITIGI